MSKCNLKKTKKITAVFFYTGLILWTNLTIVSKFFLIKFVCIIIVSLLHKYSEINLQNPHIQHHLQPFDAVAHHQDHLLC